tara:strand:+ start:2344 stop:3165 length:822 start_codon:yes stop_codon:yes gene_type:complete
MIHFLRNTSFEKFLKKKPLLFYFASNLLSYLDFLLPYETDWYFFKNIKIKKNDVIFDVGAHHGESVKVFRRFFQNTIYCFEPNKRAFKKLETNTKKFENIKIFNFGISNEETNNILYTPKINNFFFDLLGSDNLLGVKKNLSRVGFDKSNFKFQKDIVKFKKIKKKIKKVSIIKIDVEGFEFEVIKGLQNIIKINKPLIFIEYHKSSFSNVNKYLKNYKIFYFNNDNKKLFEFSKIYSAIKVLKRENSAINYIMIHNLKLKAYSNIISKCKSN